jgi:hypothetical protein
VNVDTGEFRALGEQVGAVGRKVSTLTGRVTVMGNHMNRLDADTQEDMRTLIRVFAAVMVPEAGPENEAPSTGRHLRVIEGGRQ